MKNRKVFCEDCRKDVGFVIKDEQMKGQIKGDTYNYKGKIAYCSNCKSEIYVDYVNDFNLDALYDEYRKKNNIISLDKILEICNKYGIGRRPISLLLGWGEQTFSRYCEGYIPTKQYSDILKKIYEDPIFYSKMLEKNKNNLKAESAYIKSKRAVEKLIGKNSNKKTKINMAIEYLLNKSGDVTPLMLQKSLYYVQGFYYAFYNEFLFEENCQAWAHGPVYPEIYSKYKDYKFDTIEYNFEIDYSAFTSSEISILDSVVKNICCYGGKTLEKFTHSEHPWIYARGELTELEPSKKIIKKKDIGIYFKSIKEKYNMANPDDIKLYFREMFERNF